MSHTRLPHRGLIVAVAALATLAFVPSAHAQRAHVAQDCECMQLWAFAVVADGHYLHRFVRQSRRAGLPARRLKRKLARFAGTGRLKPCRGEAGRKVCEAIKRCVQAGAGTYAALSAAGASERTAVDTSIAACINSMLTVYY